jgi:hypothetical protein
MVGILILNERVAAPGKRRPLAAKPPPVNVPDRDCGNRTTASALDAQDREERGMRAILLVLIIAIVAIVAAVATGFIDINQIRGARAPDVAATGNGITASGGQAPAFEVQTGSVRVGSEDAQVKLPQVEVVRPGANQSAPATNNAM